MYFPTTRVLTVLELLQSHPSMSGTALAARLEVNRRTLRRYITMLQDLGIPIEAERGRWGGYRLRPGWRLPPLMFTNEEALALTVGMLTVRQLGLAPAPFAVEGILAKLNRTLPLALREQTRAVQENLVFNSLPQTSTPVGPTVVTLSLGAQHNRTVWMRYRSWRGEESERKLDPYRLVNHAGRWYIIGWCHLRQDIRVFRLERIEEVKLGEETFIPPADFDPISYLKKALVNTPYRWEVEVLLKTSLEKAQARVPDEFGLLEVVKEGVLMRARVEYLEEMAQFLIWLGFAFELIKPAELRHELLDIAAKIVASAEVPKS